MLLPSVPFYFLPVSPSFLIPFVSPASALLISFSLELAMLSMLLSTLLLLLLITGVLLVHFFFLSSSSYTSSFIFTSSSFSYSSLSFSYSSSSPFSSSILSSHSCIVFGFVSSPLRISFSFASSTHSLFPLILLMLEKAFSLLAFSLTFPSSYFP